MAGFNRVILIGNLTRDPEYKQLTSGQPLCRLGLATNRQFKNRQTGAMVQEVCFIDVDVWGAQAESCKQYLAKGRPVLVEGRIKFDTWEDQQGQTRSKHTIVADRVVFLSAGGAAEVGEEVREMDAKEKDVYNQIEQIKAKTQARAAAKTTEPSVTTPAKKAPKKTTETTTASGEIAFEDTPPFSEELPF